MAAPARFLFDTDFTRPEPPPAPAEPPRRWQPPAPTVTPAAVERKSGWWSKR